jgi:hypothetical protein
MAAISKMKPGQVLYSVSNECMGNTTVPTIRVTRVVVHEVSGSRVLASVNGNAPRQWGRLSTKKWRVSKPYVVGSIMGNRRLATRDEVAKAKEAGRIHEGSVSISVDIQR